MQRAQGACISRKLWVLVKSHLGLSHGLWGLGGPGHVATAEAGWEALSTKEGLAA